MKKVKGFLLLNLFFIFFTGCMPVEPLTACTKIGCNDGIGIVLNTALTNSATIEISYNGTSKTISCSQGRCISNNIFFENITPETFTVKIVDGSNVLHQSSHSPTYSVSQPNGPDCPPDCKQAQLAIEI